MTPIGYAVVHNTTGKTYARITDEMLEDEEDSERALLSHCILPTRMAAEGVAEIISESTEANFVATLVFASHVGPGW